MIDLTEKELLKASLDGFTEAVESNQENFTNYNLKTMEQLHKIQKRALEMQVEKAEIASKLISKEEYFFIKYLAPLFLMLLSAIGVAFSVFAFFNLRYAESSWFLVVSVIALSVVYLILSGKLNRIEVPNILKVGKI